MFDKEKEKVIYIYRYYIYIYIYIYIYNFVFFFVKHSNSILHNEITLHRSCLVYMLNDVVLWTTVGCVDHLVSYRGKALLCLLQVCFYLYFRHIFLKVI